MSSSYTFDPTSGRINLYHAAISPCLVFLRNLRKMIDVAECHSEANHIPVAYYTSTRLSPHVSPLAVQIQYAVEIVQGIAAHIAGLKRDVTSSIALDFYEIVVRIDEGLAILREITPEAMAGQEAKGMRIYFAPKDWTWRTHGWDYIHRYAMPSFYFHVTMAYSLLRSCGVDVTKDDFMGTM